MKKKISGSLAVLFILLLFSFPAAAQEPVQYYKVYSQNGELVLCKGSVSINDSFIMNNTDLYRIISVNEPQKEAVAQLTETLSPPDVCAESAYIKTYREKGAGIYVRNSSAGYIPSDGSYLIKNREGGLYDCARMLARELDKRGCPAYVSNKQHSNSVSDQQVQVPDTVAQLARSYQMNLILDADMDTVPKSTTQFKTGNKYLAAIRLIVYKDQAFEESLALARRITALSDLSTPGLIRDIYITDSMETRQLGYKRLTMELGSTENDKGRVMAAIPSFAEYINLALYGGTLSVPAAQQETQDEPAKMAASGNDQEQMTDVEVKGEYRPEAVKRLTEPIFKWAAGISALCVMITAVMGKRTAR